MIRARHLFTLVAAAALAPGQQRFEVASVKPSSTKTQSMMIRELGNGRIRLEGAPLRYLIQSAYGLRRFELVGDPAWVSSEKYDINAKTEKPLNAGELWKALQTLLEDRFQFKAHREKREMAVYSLSVVKSGKLPAPKPENCSGNDPRATPINRPGREMLAPCGNIMMGPRPPAMILYGGSVKMPALMGRLTDLLGRPVLDRTGFTGIFDLDLKFAIDDSLVGIANYLRDLPGGTPEASDPAGVPNLFSVLRNQLGLKIESTRAPVEVLAIDRIERPSGN